jgi:hypothetical protein
MLKVLKKGGNALYLVIRDLSSLTTTWENIPAGSFLTGLAGEGRYLNSPTETSGPGWSGCRNPPGLRYYIIKNEGQNTPDP